MGLFSGLAKAGLAKKAVDQARRPENQRKIKGLVAQFGNRKSGGPGTPGRPGRV